MKKTNCNKNTSSENKTSSDTSVEDYLYSLDLNLANFEKLGSTIIIIGYLGFVYASNIDILDIKEINYTNETPEVILFNSQKIITLGYSILLLVSQNRINEKNFRNNYADENILLSPYYKSYYSYILSVVAHFIRLDAFAEISNIVLSEKNSNKNDSTKDED